MLADDLLKVLADAGVGTAGTTLFAGFMPDTPDACVALYEWGSQSSTRTMGSGVSTVKITRPVVQVCARATTYAAAKNLCYDAWQALEGYSGTPVATVIYSAMAAGDVSFLKRDENDRAYFVVDIDIERAPDA